MNFLKKAGLKLNALSRITPYMDFNKKWLCVLHVSIQLLSSDLDVSFNRSKNNEINRIHEKCLRLLYNDKNSSS